MMRTSPLFSTRLLPSFLTFAACGILGLGAHATTYTVTNISDSGAGSLRQAVNDANAAPDADTIVFDPTFFATPRTITPSDTIVLYSDITITGSAAGVTITNPTSRGLGLSGGIVQLDNLIFAGCDLGVQNSSFGIGPNNGSTLTLRGCTFKNNRYGYISNAGTALIQNCTFVGNTNSAISTVTTTAADSCTITGNATGVGIFGATTTVSNSLVMGNSTNVSTGFIFGGTLSDGGHNILTGTAAQAGLQTSDGVNAVVLGDNGGPTPTVALVVGGAAVNAGATSLSTDQRGLARPFGNAPDIGAFERQNSTPIAANDSYNTSEDATLTVAAPGVLGNDSDVDGDLLSSVLVSGPSNGTLTLNADGSFTYTPTAGYSGSDSFSYKASDGTALSTTATASITVNAVNKAPVVSSVVINQSAPKTNDTLTTTVTASDADEDDLTYSYVWKKNNVVIADETQSTLDLSKIGNGDVGNSITVTVIANDGNDDSAPVTSGAVVVQNTAPVLSNVIITPANPNTNSTLTATPSASDADGEGIQFGYQWKRNGTDIPGAIGNMLNLATAGNGNRGDVITVEVFATDGAASSSTVTATGVTIANTLPSINSVTLTPSAPITSDVLTANVVAADADDDELSYSYVWRKNGDILTDETAATLDLSKPGNGDDNDTITVTVTANDGTGNSPAVISASVTVLNFAPTITTVTPVGATDVSGSTRTFTVTVSDGNGPKDIKEVWLLANNRLNWSEGATFIYVPSSSSPTNGLLYLRRGDAFLPPITVGAGASETDILDNGAVRVVGNQITVSVSGNSLTLTIPAVVRDGLVGQNTLYARVIDRTGTNDPASASGDMGFVSFGPYTVTPQFTTGTNSAPTLGKLSPVTTNSSLQGASVAPVAQKFGFFATDQDGIGDLDSIWFMVGKQLNWTQSATIVYVPRTPPLIFALR